MSASPYEVVIGLEIHIQLATQSKIFAPEAFTFGKAANHQVSVVSMAHPGALPLTNSEAVYYAVKLGLAMGCPINSPAYFDRKNYFYPDLPKGYQISQDRRPICGPGKVSFPDREGSIKEVRIYHIHLEEDAGKSIHALSLHHSMIDLNRAGAGLVEMVTQPDLRSPDDAAALMMEMRRVVRYLNISDGNMQEGNLRCDANVSLRPQGQKEYGTRVEIKNINSFSFLSKALQFEIQRQAQLLDRGESIVQETRTYIPEKNRTSSMRDKETADDYRYFPEPDLPPVHVSTELQDEIRVSLPTLPSEKYREYQNLGISHNEVLALIEEVNFSSYYERLLDLGVEAREAANWMLGPVKAYLNEKQIDTEAFPLSAKGLHALIRLMEEGKINRHIAREQIFPMLMKNPDLSPMKIAEDGGFLTEKDDDELMSLIWQVLEDHPEERDRFKEGQKKLRGFFVGKIMKASKGKADPKRVNELLEKAIS